MILKHERGMGNGNRRQACIYRHTESHLNIFDPISHREQTHTHYLSISGNLTLTPGVLVEESQYTHPSTHPLRTYMMTGKTKPRKPVAIANQP